MPNFLAKFGTPVMSESSAIYYTNYWPVERFASLVIWKDRKTEKSRNFLFFLVYPANQQNMKVDQKVKLISL